MAPEMHAGEQGVHETLPLTGRPEDARPRRRLAKAGVVALVAGAAVGVAAVSFSLRGGLLAKSSASAASNTVGLALASANSGGEFEILDPMAPAAPQAGAPAAKEEVIREAKIETKEEEGDAQAEKKKSKKEQKGPGKGAAGQSSWKSRRGSFIVIGDWGYDPVSHYSNINKGTCVKTIAQKMLEKMEELGDVKFVINVGDSFYPSGVASKDDPQWQTKWRDVFDKKVRSVPWYSIYGNHDYHIDPCACSDDVSKCAQVNANESDLEFFQMPNYTYFKPVPEFDMEIIGMDLNRFEPGWDKTKGLDELGFNDCEWTPCKDKCFYRAEQRTGASMSLFWERMEESKAKNLLVFSHYPTDYFVGGAPEFIGGLSNNSLHDITFFGGHRHSTDQWSTESIAPNQNWIVGGGGGWSCDSENQGIVVGEIQEDFSVKTYPVYVDKSVCCLFPTTTAPASSEQEFM